MSSSTPAKTSNENRAASTTLNENNNKNNKKPIPSWRDAAAGASAGAFSKTVTAPLERIKLLIQLQHSLDHAPSTTTITKPQPKQSAWQVAQSLYVNEGIVSFWRGNLPSVMRVSGTAAINFTMMNYYKDAVRPLLNSPTLFSPTLSQEQLERRRQTINSFVSGGLAGGTSTTILYPVEFLRTRLAADLQRGKQTGRYKFQGMSDAFSTILKSDGITGFYQGYGVALFGGIFYRILLLGGYDVLKSETVRRNQQQQQQLLLQSQQQSQNDTSTNTSTEVSWGQRIVIAQTISLTAGTMSYPLDSVRRRLMMQAGQPRSQRRYRNSIHCFIEVAKTEGIKGFFLGLGPNILRSVSGALLLVAYDGFRDAMR